MRAVKLGLLAALMFTPIGADAALAQTHPAGPEPAAETPAAQPAAGRVVVRSGEFSELGGQGSEMAFVTGRQVRVTAQITDDIFAAGRELSVEGASADHLFLAGREMDLAPASVHDVIAAGGHIRLRSGAVRDDVVAAGGEINLEREARIEGSTVLTGGRLRIEAPVGRELVARGGRMELNGPVAGDVRILADEIVIGPQARIGGDLYARGERIDISPAAVVQGRTVREVVRRHDHAAARFGLVALLLALGVLIMNGVVAAAAPRLTEDVDQRLRSRFWPTMGVGGLIVLLTPLVILVLLATMLGAPLALLLALAYLLAIPLAFAGVSYSLGQFIRGRIDRARSATPPGWMARVGWTAAAALLLIIACMIPILGEFIWLLALATGMGGLAAHVVLRESRAAPATA
jgi:hypothetical protein